MNDFLCSCKCESRNIKVNFKTKLLLFSPKHRSPNVQVTHFIVYKVGCLVIYQRILICSYISAFKKLVLEKYTMSLEFNAFIFLSVVIFYYLSMVVFTVFIFITLAIIKLQTRSVPFKSHTASPGESVCSACKIQVHGFIARGSCYEHPMRTSLNTK